MEWKESIELRCYIPVVALTAISVILIVVGFFVPPLGVVDGSVIQAVGEVFAFAALFEIPHCIAVAQGKSISLKHGDTEVNISGCEEANL